MSAWGNKDDKTSAGTVTLTAPAITFNGATGHAAGVYTSVAHPFQLGDPVAYANGGGTSVVGLTSGTTYFVTNVAADTFSVAATEANAIHNFPTIIASTDGVGASHTFTLSLDYGRATLTGSGTNFDPALAVGDVVRVGDQEMIATAVASDTVATVINANPGSVLTVFSGENYTISEKPTSIASVSTTDFQSTQVFGVDNTEIAAGGDNVASVALIQGGTRYLEVPTVEFSGGGGASAAATATIAAGSVTAIAVTNTGSSYETVPTVTVHIPRRTVPTSAVTIAEEKFTYATHGLVSGEEIKYYQNGGTAVTGLVNGTSYFVSALGFTTGLFRLAASESAAAGRTALAGVAISGTGGQFTCTATTLAAGDRIRITGTLGGTGTITSYATGTIYTVSAVTGTSPNVTGFTLTTEAGSALTTTAGTPTGLTYTPFTLVLISGTGNNAQYFDLVNATTATAVAAKGTGETGTSAAHSGWVQRTVGTGANAGRVKYEVLVALSKNAIASSDAADDIEFPDA